MRVTSLVASVFLSCEASRDLSTLVGDSSGEQGVYRDMCNFYLPSVPADVRVGTLASLDIIKKWESLLHLEECQVMVNNHSALLFHDCATMLNLLDSDEDDSVVKAALNYLTTLDGQHGDGDGERVVKFLIYFLAQTKVPLARALVNVNENIREMILLKAERIFNQGFFTITGRIKDFQLFFLDLAINGVITRESYVKCLDSILENLYEALPDYFNYLLKEVFDSFSAIMLPEELLNKFDNIVLISGLDGRTAISSRKVLPFLINEDANLNPIQLELNLPEIILDFKIPEYVSLKFLNAVDTLGSQFKYILYEISMSISRKTLELVGKHRFEEARNFLNQKIFELVSKDIFSVIYPYLNPLLVNEYNYRSIVFGIYYLLRDGISMREEVKIDQDSIYMSDFEILKGMEDDFEAISEWSKNKNMVKRFQFWFEREECHDFIRKNGMHLLNNAHTAKRFLEMGQQMWNTLESFSLITQLEGKIESLKLISEKTFDLVVAFYTHFLDLLGDRLVPMFSNYAKIRETCLQKIACNLKEGNFTATASLGGHLSFIFKAISRGYIGAESSAKFIKSFLAQVIDGSPFYSNYITVELKGRPFTMDPEREVFDNQFDWDKSGLERRSILDFHSFAPMKINTIAAQLSNKGSSSALQVDVMMPRHFKDKKFIRIIMNFILNGKFQDDSNLTFDGSLEMMALELIVKQFFADLYDLRISAEEEGVEALKDLLGAIDNVELSNRLYYVLKSLLIVIPVETRLLTWEDVESEYMESCSNPADESEIRKWSADHEWNIFWEDIIAIPECRLFIQQNAFEILLESEWKFIQLFEKGDSVWESFIELGIVKDIIKIQKGISTNSAKFKDLFILKYCENLKYFGNALLDEIDTLTLDKRKTFFKSIAAALNAGNAFTKYSTILDYAIFFYHATMKGFITVKGYQKVVDTILKYVQNSRSSLKKAYLISQLFPQHNDDNSPSLPIPSFLLEKFDLPSNIIFNVVDMTGVPEHNIRTMVIPNISIHPVIFDKYLPRYIAHGVMANITTKPIPGLLLIGQDISMDKVVLPFSSLPPHLDPLGQAIEEFATLILNRFKFTVNICELWLSSHGDLQGSDEFLQALVTYIHAFYSPKKSTNSRH